MSVSAFTAFSARASPVALEIGLLASDVLSTLPSPTMLFVIPPTVPVKVGPSRLAFKLKEASVSTFTAFNAKASPVALEIGLLASDVLSTLPSPTISFEIPLTVPVKVGFALGAFSAIELVIVVEKSASLPKAVANSFNVFNASGALLTKSLTVVLTKAVVAIFLELSLDIGVVSNVGVPVNVAFVNMVALLSLVTFSIFKSDFTWFRVLPSIPEAVKRAYESLLPNPSIFTVFVSLIPNVRLSCLPLNKVFTSLVLAFKLKEASVSAFTAFNARASLVALDIGLLASEVLSTLPSPISVFTSDTVRPYIPELPKRAYEVFSAVPSIVTVFVSLIPNVRLSCLPLNKVFTSLVLAFKLKEASVSAFTAFNARASLVALDIGLLASEVLSTLPSPISVFTSDTVRPSIPILVKRAYEVFSPEPSICTLLVSLIPNVRLSCLESICAWISLVTSFKYPIFVLFIFVDATWTAP